MFYFILKLLKKIKIQILEASKENLIIHNEMENTKNHLAVLM